MIPRIRAVKPLENYILYIAFDDGKEVNYDVKSDMNEWESYRILGEKGLFFQVQVDESRTVVYWNEDVDFPSDILYEYGKEITEQ